jgi:hypothetical protein
VSSVPPSSAPITTPIPTPIPTLASLLTGREVQVTIVDQHGWTLSPIIIRRPSGIARAFSFATGHRWTMVSAEFIGAKPTSILFRCVLRRPLGVSTEVRNRCLVLIPLPLPTPTPPPKLPAAVSLGKRGGKKGGATPLSPARQEAVKKMQAGRWAKKAKKEQNIPS